MISFAVILCFQDPSTWASRFPPLEKFTKPINSNLLSPQSPPDTPSMVIDAPPPIPDRNPAGGTTFRFPTHEGIRRSPFNSPRVSPRASPRASPFNSPFASPRNSPFSSPRVSPRTSPVGSPRGSVSNNHNKRAPPPPPPTDYNGDTPPVLPPKPKFFHLADSPKSKVQKSFPQGCHPPRRVKSIPHGNAMAGHQRSGGNNNLTTDDLNEGSRSLSENDLVDTAELNLGSNRSGDSSKPLSRSLEPLSDHLSEDCSGSAFKSIESESMSDSHKCGAKSFVNPVCSEVLEQEFSSWEPQMNSRNGDESPISEVEIEQEMQAQCESVGATAVSDIGRRSPRVRQKHTRPISLPGQNPSYSSQTSGSDTSSPSGVIRLNSNVFLNRTYEPIWDPSSSESIDDDSQCDSIQSDSQSDSMQSDSLDSLERTHSDSVTSLTTESGEPKVRLSPKFTRSVSLNRKSPNRPDFRHPPRRMPSLERENGLLTGLNPNRPVPLPPGQKGEQPKRRHSLTGLNPNRPVPLPPGMTKDEYKRKSSIVESLGPLLACPNSESNLMLPELPVKQKQTRETTNQKDDNSDSVDDWAKLEPAVHASDSPNIESAQRTLHTKTDQMYYTLPDASSLPVVSEVKLNFAEFYDDDESSASVYESPLRVIPSQDISTKNRNNGSSGFEDDFSRMFLPPSSDPFQGDDFFKKNFSNAADNMGTQSQFSSKDVRRKATHGAGHQSSGKASHLSSAHVRQGPDGQSARFDGVGGGTTFSNQNSESGHQRRTLAEGDGRENTRSIEFYEEDFNILMEQGYSRDQVSRALIVADNNFAMARKILKEFAAPSKHT